MALGIHYSEAKCLRLVSRCAHDAFLKTGEEKANDM